MNILNALELIKFNVELGRFANIHGDNIEKEDIQTYSKELYNISRVGTVKIANLTYCIDDAFLFIDLLAQELEEKALQGLGLRGITLEALRFFFSMNYSKYCEFWEYWSDYESDLIDLLNNFDMKNYVSLNPANDEEENFMVIYEKARERAIKLLFQDIRELDKAEKVEIMEFFKC